MITAAAAVDPRDGAVEGVRDPHRPAAGDDRACPVADRVLVGDPGVAPSITPTWSGRRARGRPGASGGRPRTPATRSGPAPRPSRPSLAGDVACAVATPARPRGAVTSVERRVLDQDRVVQARSSGAGLDADLLDERGSRLPVGLQRLRLAAGAVQREHPLRVQASRSGFAGHAAPRARRAPRRGDRPPGPRRSRARSRAAAGPPGAGSRRRRTARRRRRTAASPRHSAAPHAAAHPQQPFEADARRPALREPELIAAPARDDPAPLPSAAAQMGHVQLHHLRRARRALVPPTAPPRDGPPRPCGRPRSASIANTARCLRGSDAMGRPSRHASIGPSRCTSMRRLSRPYCGSMRE